MFPFPTFSRSPVKHRPPSGSRTSSCIRWRQKWWVLGIIAALLASLPARAEPVGEVEVKAAFLVNFINFVFWPKSDEDDETKAKPKTIMFCVYGNNPFGTNLDYVIEKKRQDAKNPRIDLDYLDNLEQLEKCHVLYISDSEKYRLRFILDKIENQPILTVGSIDGFAREGGMIQFYIKDSNLRFYMNLEALKASQLEPHVTLIKLSTLVKTDHD